MLRGDPQNWADLPSGRPAQPCLIGQSYVHEFPGKATKWKASFEPSGGPGLGCDSRKARAGAEISGLPFSPTDSPSCFANSDASLNPPLS